jgi:hypothetical protein
MDSEEYNLHWKALSKWRIHRLADITSLEKPGHILPFSRITNRIKCSKTRDAKNTISDVPEWYGSIIKQFGNSSEVPLTVDSFIPLKIKTTQYQEALSIPHHVKNVYVSGGLTHFGPAATIAWANNKERRETTTRYIKGTHDDIHAILLAIIDILMTIQKYGDAQRIQISCPHIIRMIHLPRDSMTVRQKLKVGHYSLLERIYKHKGSTEIIACNDSNNLATGLPSIQHPPQMTMTTSQGMHASTNLSEIFKYPGAHLKERARIETQHGNDKKIQKIWSQKALPNQSLHLVKYGRGTGQTVNALNHLEQSFRIKTIFQKLSTLKDAQKFSSKDIQDISCPRCTNNVPESFSHLWECDDTVTKKAELISETELNMESRHGQYIQQDDTGANHIGSIIAFLEASFEQFVQTETAKGILTQEFISRLTEAIGDQKQISRWTFLFVDSWLSAFYTIIWQYRNEMIARRIETQKGTPVNELLGSLSSSHGTIPAEDLQSEQKTHALPHGDLPPTKRLKITLTLKESSAQRLQAETTIPFDPGGTLEQTTSYQDIQAESADRDQEYIQMMIDKEYGNSWYVTQPEPQARPTRLQIRDINRVHRRGYRAQNEPELFKPPLQE